MNLDLYVAFSEAIFPNDADRRNNLVDELKAGRFKEFSEALMQEVINAYREDGTLPKLYCEDVKEVLPTADKQNWKVLSHCASCESCISKVV